MTTNYISSNTNNYYTNNNPTLSSNLDDLSNRPDSTILRGRTQLRPLDNNNNTNNYTYSSIPNTMNNPNNNNYTSINNNRSTSYSNTNPYDNMGSRGGLYSLNNNDNNDINRPRTQVIRRQAGLAVLQNQNQNNNVYSSSSINLSDNNNNNLYSTPSTTGLSPQNSIYNINNANNNNSSMYGRTSTSSTPRVTNYYTNNTNLPSSPSNTTFPRNPSTASSSMNYLSNNNNNFDNLSNNTYQNQSHSLSPGRYNSNNNDSYNNNNSYINNNNRSNSVLPNNKMSIRNNTLNNNSNIVSRGGIGTESSFIANNNNINSGNSIYNSNNTTNTSVGRRTITRQQRLSDNVSINASNTNEVPSTPQWKQVTSPGGATFGSPTLSSSSSSNTTSYVNAPAYYRAGNNNPSMLVPASRGNIYDNSTNSLNNTPTNNSYITSTSSTFINPNQDKTIGNNNNNISNNNNSNLGFGQASSLSRTLRSAAAEMDNYNNPNNSNPPTTINNTTLSTNRIGTSIPSSSTTKSSYNNNNIAPSQLASAARAGLASSNGRVNTNNSTNDIQSPYSQPVRSNGFGTITTTNNTNTSINTGNAIVNNNSYTNERSQSAIGRNLSGTNNIINSPITTNNNNRLSTASTSQASLQRPPPTSSLSTSSISSLPSSSSISSSSIDSLSHPNTNNNSLSSVTDPISSTNTLPTNPSISAINNPATTALRSVPNGSEDVIALPHRVVTSVTNVQAVGAVSWRGRNPNATKINQDAVVVAEHGPTASLLVAVFDGHGVNGREVSSFFKERYPLALFTDKRFQTRIPPATNRNRTGAGSPLHYRSAKNNGSGNGSDGESTLDDDGSSQASDLANGKTRSPNKHKNTSTGSTNIAASALCDVMADVLLATELALIQASGINVTLSGSTSVVVLIRDGILHIVNIGDSRGILASAPQPSIPIAASVIAAASAGSTTTGNPAPGVSPGQGNLPDADAVLTHPSVRVRVLTIDHKPDMPKERQRIISCGGRVMSTRIKGAPHLLGPPRVWLKNAPLPGLNMSRSLGDLIAKQAGVISTPHKAIHAIVPSDRALILASDGLWDFVTNEETSSIALSTNDTWESAARLARLARSRWLTKTLGADDTTVVIVRLGINNITVTTGNTTTTVATPALSSNNLAT